MAGAFRRSLKVLGWTAVVGSAAAGAALAIDYYRDPAYFAKRNAVYTKLLGRVGNARIPHPLLGWMIEAYSRFYGVKKEDMVDKISDFKSLQDFFTRRVKPREVDQGAASLVSPADALLLSVNKVERDDVFIVKERPYSLCEFLTDNQNCRFDVEQLKQLRKDPANDLYSLVFYLNPGDYHRFHSPARFQVDSVQHASGHLQSVSVATILNSQKVFEQNERVLLSGTSPLGAMVFTAVGAQGVGTIDIRKADVKPYPKPAVPNPKGYWSPVSVTFEKGEEVGMFKLGSTVVLLAEVPPGFRFQDLTGQKVRYGQVIGSV